MLDSAEELELAVSIIDHVHQMVREGLVEGTSGNISARIPGTRTMIITPGSYSYDRMTIGDLLKVDAENLDVLRGFRSPSSETEMHAAVYRARSDVGGLVHTHSRYATAWSTLAISLPAIHYVINSVGNEVPVTPYFTYGTKELAEAASRTLMDHNATLLQNHGVLAAGPDLPQAMKNAIRVEFLAQEMLILGIGAQPHLLSAADLDRVRDRGRRKADTQ